MEVLREEFAKCTLIVVAHRIGAIVDIDRVAVIAAGNIVEWDGPEKLFGADSQSTRPWELSG
ncbi:MAG: hypothetical protein M1819_002830 [Sarea resinae]|nr:MAG: hypothetical protein M1819_002830 [Sarea resinae]